MARQLLLAVIVSVVVSTSIGFALGAASSPQNAGAASTNDVVTELQKLNSKIGKRQGSKGSVRGLLTIICNYTASIDCGP